MRFGRKKLYYFNDRTIFKIVAFCPQLSCDIVSVNVKKESSFNSVFIFTNGNDSRAKAIDSTMG